MNIETKQPLSRAPEGKNLIPLDPQGIKNNREYSENGKIIASYGTNPDGSPFLQVTRDPENRDQKPKVYLEPDTAALHYVIKGNVEEIIVFGTTDITKAPKSVSLEGHASKLEAFNNVIVSAKSAESAFALGSHIEIGGNLDKAAAQFGGSVHAAGDTQEKHFDYESSILDSKNH